ncbi:hypothetical protein M404DRAFT_515786 [Pisolithus tinctorius Marx 270]|uniref:UvrD-like helicase ATP-binding domain-containing protein n=1 Tax=Pisolithus tinctorius Marx 270 TaxID=870435 RepID=A0A0C3NCP7_PISTI|nr:hypothetical protein M404DRAFT_515786 [Pisolithus tinctorius Marx 270]
MTSGAARDLLQLRRNDAKMTACVFKKIRQLSRGEFSGNNYKALHGPSHGIPIYQAEVLSNLRLVYQIDCILDGNGKEERQVVKVYGIYRHKELDHIWPWLSKLLSGRGKLYQQRCTLRERAESGSGVYRPATFSPRIEEFTMEESPIFVRESGLNEDHSSLMSNKCINLSKAFLNGLVAEQEVELPFELTAKEWQIVRCMTSCYVIGRSGTGKTTAMVFKILDIQKDWEQVPYVKKPRQLFITRFPVLAAKVEEFFTGLVESLALAGRTRDELQNLRSQTQSAEQQPRMIDPLNALNYRPGTPQKFSELSDHDFPLFITFDQLARMVAADIQVDYSKGCDCLINSKDCDRLVNSKEYDRLKFILDKVVNDESSFITYEMFRVQYWPRLRETYRSSLSRHFGPWLVFGEFMGVIKGSEIAFHSPNGILDRQTYVNLSTRAYPVFAEDRDPLYSAFELYSELKRERYDYDMADRTYAILKALSCKCDTWRNTCRNALKEHLVDYLYVDEVQDNLIIDTIFLRSLCRNAEGLFWAGDTAQTISAGSSFRFADLKASIHCAEAEGRLGIQKSCSKPEMFELAINYRSHSGIVNCAQSVVKLITHFWPESIDVLKPERAMLGGPKPVFFVGWQDEIFPYDSFFSGLKGNWELGAEQCIIVRDSTAREQIKERFGDIATILTLQGSKGLEFDDVFLYNFFENSSATLAQWYSLLRDVSRSPHSALCTELKNLYVGITRARKRLYILDHSQKSEPMRVLWSKEDLIDVAPPGANIRQYAHNSTAEQWAASGYKLFNAGQFQQAIRCFERGNRPEQLQIARAYQLRESAVLTFQAGERQKAFLTAAEAFVRCADDAPSTRKSGFYGHAAKCYASANDFLKAAKLYTDANDFAGAAMQYHKAGRFDEIAQILYHHREKISASYRDELLFICVVHYYHRNRLRPPVPLFSSRDEVLKYLEGKGLHKARMDLLDSYKRFFDVAELQLSRGRLCDAIQTLLEHQDNPSAVQRAVNIALGTLWRACSFDTPVQEILQNKGSDAHRVLNCIQSISLEHVKISDSGQIRFFRAVQKSPSAEEVYRLGEEFSDRGEHTLALMAFDVFFSRMPTLSVHPSKLDTFLKRFEKYVRLLASVISDETPFRATDPQVRKVFGIVPLSDHNYTVRGGTFLHRRFTENRYLATEINLKVHLKAHLRKKVLEEYDISYVSQAFSTQCPYFVLHRRRCQQKHCNRHHVPMMSLDAALYNMKVNVHLQQIRILDLMFSAVGDHEDCMVAALRRLYAAIYSPIYIEGSTADLDWNAIRNATECIRVVQKWIPKTVEYLKPTVNRVNDMGYLMNIIRVTCLHRVFGGTCHLQKYVSRESCRIPYEPALTEENNVSADVVASLTELDPTRGVRALWFLLLNGVGMDLSVVCNFAEEICSTFISSLRPSGGPSPLHDLVVPRRWIMNPNKPKVHRNTILQFLNYVRRLMNTLRSGRARTKFDLLSSEESFVDVMVTQMCRMLYICASAQSVSNSSANITFSSGVQRARRRT